MKIILSPAKKMVTDTDSIAPVGMPNFLDKTTEILSWMKGLEKDKLKAIWKCNDKIARQNFERLENMDLCLLLLFCPMRELHSSIWHQQCLNTDNLSISKSILESYPHFMEA